MSSQNKYISILEVGFASLGITFGMATAGPETVQEQIKIPAKAQEIPRQEVTVNTQTDNSPYANVVIVCTYVSIGLGLIGMKIVDLYKEFKKANDDTPQGKLQDCEERLSAFAESQKSRDEHTKELFERMSNEMELLRKSNDTLNKTVEGQIKVIARLSNPTVITTDDESINKHD